MKQHQQTKKMAKTKENAKFRRKDRVKRFGDLYDKVVLYMHENGDINGNKLRELAKESCVSMIKTDHARIAFSMRKADWVDMIMKERCMREDEAREKRMAKARQQSCCDEEEMRETERVMEDLLVHDEVEQAAEDQFFSDPFLLQRKRLNDLFGEEYVTANPILIAAAVIEDELKAVRLEMTQLQIAIDNLQK